MEWKEEKLEARKDVITEMRGMCDAIYDAIRNLEDDDERFLSL